MWVNRDTPKWSEVHRTLPHDEVWRTTGELFTLAQGSGLVRPGDNMGSLIASMRKHSLAESQSGKPIGAKARQRPPERNMRNTSRGNAGASQFGGSCPGDAANPTSDIKP